MRYPIAIEPGTDATARSVVVHDWTGCVSAGEAMEEAMIRAGEAVTAWIGAALDAEQDIPTPSNIESLRAANTDFAVWW